MLAASPKRLARRLLPVVLVGFYGCSDPSAPASPRVELRAPSLDVSVVNVTNTDDSGPGSLRQAIADAPDGSVIQFDASIAGKTIVSPGLHIEKKALTIEGPLPTGITISGGFMGLVLAVQDGAAVTLRNLSIVDGRNGIGGAIDVLRGRLLLDHVLVANNDAVEDGGAIAAFDNAIVTIVNSTISGNVAPGRGGAIIVSDESELTIRNSTIANNTSASSGAVVVEDGLFTVRNTIFGNFVTGGNCSIDPGVTASFIGNNLSDDVTCGSNGITMMNALLKPLANNGGPTRTHAIDITSAAVDAGTLCSESTDQRYVARPAGASCDVGAFEFNDYGTFKFSIGPNISVNPKSGVATVTGTIACSKPAGAATVSVAMSQTQKSTGRFTTIVQGTGAFNVASCGTSPGSWSTTITPGSGRFESGTATASVSTVTIPTAFIQGSASAAVKVFFVK